jgi:hypothetical protein
VSRVSARRYSVAVGWYVIIAVLVNRGSDFLLFADNEAADTTLSPATKVC